MLDRPLPWILAAASLALTLAACHKTTPRPEQPAPSEAFGQYRDLHKQAEDLLDKTKRGLAAETVTKTAVGIEQKLIELEPGVNKLPKAERPHARRFVDQTLSLLEAIQDLLAERGSPAP